MRAYWALLRHDLTLTLRKRVVLFFHYLFPVATFLSLSELAHAEASGLVTHFMAMLIVLGVVANGFFGAGMRAVQERENGILRRFSVTPVGPLPLLVASLASGVVIFLPAAVLVIGVARLVYAVSLPEHPISLMAFLTLGVVAFRALGLVIAAVANSVQESQMMVQLAYVPLGLLSGTTIPVESLPAWLRRLARLLPTTHLMEGVRRIVSEGEGLVENATSAVLLLVTAALGVFLSAQLFRWDKEQRIRPAAKLWVLAALTPFLALGAFQIALGAE